MKTVLDAERVRPYVRKTVSKKEVRSVFSLITACSAGTVLKTVRYRLFRGIDMKAVLLNNITEGKDIVLSECPVPEVKPSRSSMRYLLS